MIYMRVLLRLASPLRPKPFVRPCLALQSLRNIDKLSTSSQSRPRALPHHNKSFPSPIFTNHRPLSTLSAILLPPVVFAGLIVTLWTWKCLMMVLFQNKIIYMPFLPPNARSDTIEEYEGWCSGVRWSEKHIKSGDGTDIALAVAEIGKEKGETEKAEKVVLYFQGNASSLPGRLPNISQVLRLLIRDNPAPHLKLIAVSYRGYWKSGGRPTEVGMFQDAKAALCYAISSSSSSSSDAASTSATGPLKVVIWGQSIGCAFASHLAACVIEGSQGDDGGERNMELETLILETPFTSASEMLKTLYPQKWLPYRYLSVFLWNRLDTIGALKRIKDALGSEQKRQSKTILKDNRKSKAGDSRDGTPQHRRSDVMRSGVDINEPPALVENRACFQSTDTQTPMSNHAGSRNGKAAFREGQHHGWRLPRRLSVVMLEGEKDELVPKEHGDKIEGLLGKSDEGGALVFRRIRVGGALHTQVLAKGSGRIATAEAIRGENDDSI